MVFADYYGDVFRFNYTIDCHDLAEDSRNAIGNEECLTSYTFDQGFNFFPSLFYTDVFFLPSFFLSISSTFSRNSFCICSALTNKSIAVYTNTDYINVRTIEDPYDKNELFASSIEHCAFTYTEPVLTEALFEEFIDMLARDPVIRTPF